MSKVVVITGASSGMGKTTAHYLTKQGHRIIGTSRTPDKYSISAFDLLPLDMNQPDTIKPFVDEVLKRMGRIDVLINNAGVGITGPSEEIALEAVVSNFQTNCFGPLLLAQAVLPIMREQKSGLIINITSIAGAMGLPFRGIYSASKGAFSLVTEALRMEVKRFGIHMCDLAPGDYATDIASRRYYAPTDSNSPYQKMYQHSLDTMDQHVDSGRNPIEIAHTIAKIMQDNNPRVRYRVGAPLQKISVLLKALLPSKTYEKLLMKHYKI